MADLCSRYAALLADASTFAELILEELLDSDAFPAPTISALRERYAVS
jgi:hypothetical protein